MSHPGLSHIEQECQEFGSRKDAQSTKFESRPQIFVKLSFIEFTFSTAANYRLEALPN